MSYCKLEVATFYSQPKFFVGSKLAVKAGAMICAQDLVGTDSSLFPNCNLKFGVCGKELSNELGVELRSKYMQQLRELANLHEIGALRRPYTLSFQLVYLTQCHWYL